MRVWRAAIEAPEVDLPDPEPGLSVVGLAWHGTPAALGWFRVDAGLAEGGLAVDRAHRGLELGKMLLAALEARAGGAGADRLRLRPPDPEGLAAWWLRRVGYVEDGAGFVRGLP